MNDEYRLPELFILTQAQNIQVSWPSAVVIEMCSSAAIRPGQRQHETTSEKKYIYGAEGVDVKMTSPDFSLVEASSYINCYSHNTPESLSELSAVEVHCG